MAINWYRCTSPRFCLRASPIIITERYLRAPHKPNITWALQMLSPPIAPQPPQSHTAESSGPISPTTTRRRGLSYLRSLSSRDHNPSANSSEAPRISPRSLFTRSTSYQETKESRGSDGRRRSRSHSRPHDLAPASVSLIRVASEQGAQTQAETATSSTATGEDMVRY